MTERLGGKVLNIKDWDKVAILIDFDGTITTADTNDKLMYNHMNDKIKELFSKEEEMNYIEFMDSAFAEVKIMEKDYLEFILNEIPISKGFVEFYKNIKSNNIPVAIVSGGFQNGIIPFLEKHGIRNVDIHANTLNFHDDNITVSYYDDGNLECCDMGPCGNCKIQHYEKLKEQGYKVIFIGDGVTDQSVAREADVVFAKDGLEVFCKENQIEYIPWNDFRDINKIVYLDNQLII